MVKQRVCASEWEFRVLKGDALRLKSIVGSNIDCIVTEPDLGPALKDVANLSLCTEDHRQSQPIILWISRPSTRRFSRRVEG